MKGLQLTVYELYKDHKFQLDINVKFIEKTYLNLLERSSNQEIKTRKREIF